MMIPAMKASVMTVSLFTAKHVVFSPLKNTSWLYSGPSPDTEQFPSSLLKSVNIDSTEFPTMSWTTAKLPVKSKIHLFVF